MNFNAKNIGVPILVHLYLPHQKMYFINAASNAIPTIIRK